MSGIIPGPNQN